MAFAHGGGVRTGSSVIAALIAVAIIPRIFMAASLPEGGGDWNHSYLPVALNILQNGCVSLSDPASGACLPSWGGNHLPGYSAFVAAVWSIFPHSIPAVSISQTIVYALAVFYFATSLSAIVENRVVPVLAVLMLMLSPQLLPWSRFTITETLSIAVALWLFAELIRSLHRRKLGLISIGLALAAAIFLRYDGILLAVPVAMVGLTIHPFRTAVTRGLIVAVIMALPLGAWAVRSLSLGLSLTPDLTWTRYGGVGYLAWGATWRTSQYQDPDWEYPIASAGYSRIRIDPDIYIDEAEKKLVEDLLGKLANFDGKIMPADFDEAFAVLAHVRRTEYPIRTWLVVPAIRAWNMWFNPYNSHGWPVSVRDSRAKSASTNADRLQRAFEIAMSNPLALLIKGGNAVWRLMVLVSTVGLFAWLRRSMAASASRSLTDATIVFAVARTVFFAETGLVEVRYMLPAVALMEISLIVLAAEYFRRRRCADASNVPQNQRGHQ
jgi:hypothetical protein